MTNPIPTASRLTNRRLRAGLAGLALSATFFVAPGLAGAESVVPSNPVDITNPTPGDDPRPDTLDDFTNPEPECPAIECDIAIPEPGDDCPAIECDFTNPEPGDEPDVPEDTTPEDTTPEDTTPEVTPDVEPQDEVEVQPAVVDAPVQATPTFTG